MILWMYYWSMSAQQACTCSQSISRSVAQVGNLDTLILSRCQTFSMGLRSREEGGWMREGIPHFVLAFFATLQVWQGAPSSTTRISCHLAVLSCLAARLSGLFGTNLTYFFPFIPFPFFCTFTWWDAQSQQTSFLAMSNCPTHHEALPRCYICFGCRCKLAGRP
jgi:hypothetical protein